MKPGPLPSSATRTTRTPPATSSYATSELPGCRVSTVTSWPATAIASASACTCRPSPPTITGGYSQDSISTRIRSMLPPRSAPMRRTGRDVARPG